MLMKKQASFRTMKVLAVLAALFLAGLLMVSGARLPTVGSDSGSWGTVLNEFLGVEHAADGGHRNVTIRDSLEVINASNNRTLLLLNSTTGRLGLGTGNPSTLMQIAAGEDESSTLTIGKPGQVTSHRQAALYLDAPADDTYPGTAHIRLKRNGTELWQLGIDQGSSGGMKSNVSDFYFHDGTTYQVVFQRGGDALFNGDVGVGTVYTHGKLSVNGTEDEIQLFVQGYPSQVSNIVEVRKGSGVRAFRVNSAGSVLIGNATDNFYMALSNENFKLEHTADAGNLYIRARDADDSSGEIYLNDYGGNVGIGTTNPTTPLQIDDDSGYFLTMKNPTGATADKRTYRFESGSADLRLRALDDSNIFVRDLITFQHDGNVGIGTATPGSELHVNGEVNFTGISGDGSGKVVCIKSDQTLGTCTDQPGGSGTCTCS